MTFLSITGIAGNTISTVAAGDGHTLCVCVFLENMNHLFLAGLYVLAFIES